MAKKAKKTSVKKTAKAKKKTPAKKPAESSAKKVRTEPKAKKSSIQSASKKAHVASHKRSKHSSARTSKTVKRRKPIQTQLNAEELEHFRQLLLEKLQEILGDVDWIENEALRKSRLDSMGNLSTMPIHMADLGTDNYEQEFSLDLMDSERKIVQEILEALNRISIGTYGICEGTGQPIPKARLEANPWARYCVEYASLIEQGKVIEGEFYGGTGSDKESGEDEEDMENAFDLEEDEEGAEAFSYGEDADENDEEDEEEEGLYYEEESEDEEEKDELY